MLLLISSADDGKEAPLFLIVDFQKLPKIIESQTSLLISIPILWSYTPQFLPYATLLANSSTRFSRHWIVVRRILRIVTTTTLDQDSEDTSAAVYCM
jgi:hypothetical protein